MFVIFYNTIIFFNFIILYMYVYYMLHNCSYYWLDIQNPTPHFKTWWMISYFDSAKNLIIICNLYEYLLYFQDLGPAVSIWWMLECAGSKWPADTGWDWSQCCMSVSGGWGSECHASKTVMLCTLQYCSLLTYRHLQVSLQNGESIEHLCL